MSLLVSVVIPAHNEERFLPKAVDSILSQNYDNIEIVLVNDNSDDKTHEICLHYYQKHENIVYITLSEQQGGSAAKSRNIGAKNSSGEILIFHDADCEADRDMVKNIVEDINVGCYDGVASRTLAYTPETLIARAVAAERKRNWESYTEHSFEVSKKSKILIANMTKEAFEKLGGFKEDVYYFEDQDLTNRFFQAGFRALYNPKIIEYHHDPDNLQDTYLQSRSIGKAIALETQRGKGYGKLILPFYSLFVVIRLFFFTINPFIDWIFILPLVVIFLRIYLKSKDLKGSLVFVPLFLFRNVIKLIFAFKYTYT